MQSIVRSVVHERGQETMSKLDAILRNFSGQKDVEDAILDAYDLGIQFGRQKPPKDESRDGAIEDMLAALEDHFDNRGTRNPFIESLREQWEHSRSLSPKQVSALIKFHDNI